MIQDWKSFWHDLTAWQKWWPLAFVLTYWAALVLIHGFRGDHANIGIVLLALAYGGRRPRKFLKVFWPILATGIVYDSQRFYSDFIRGPIHVKEPYLFDKSFFGIRAGTGILTPNEYFAIHHNAFLDLVTGFAYLVFIGEYFLFALYVYGVKKESKLAYRIMLSFFVLNVIGYSTYYWYAAAPPWYVSLYGLGPANMSAVPNPAACLRFDELLGTSFFTGMYGRSADVFGAIPSLHVAYPLQAFLYSFFLRGKGARFWQVFTGAFWVLMLFSAVYLQHHYILDMIWGDAYALFVFAGTEWYFRRGLVRTEAIASAKRSPEKLNLFIHP